jgi:hypothetical protein
MDRTLEKVRSGLVDDDSVFPTERTPLWVRANPIKK